MKFQNEGIESVLDTPNICHRLSDHHELTRKRQLGVHFFLQKSDEYAKAYLLQFVEKNPDSGKVLNDDPSRFDRSNV